MQTKGILLLKSQKGWDKIPLIKDEFIIGRGKENDLALDDHLVSKNHAKLVRRDDSYRLIDLDSRNGTFLNGERVKMARLKDGDEIRLGIHLLRFQLSTVEKRIHFHDESIDLEGTLVKSLGEGSLLQTLHGRVIEGREDEALKRDHEHLVLLYKMSERLARTHSLTELLDEILDATLETLGAERGVLLLKDDATGEFIPSTFRTRGKEEKIRVSRTIINRAVQDRVAILTSDARMDKRFSGSESIVKLGTRSALCAPLWKEDKIMGAIYVDVLSFKKAFTDEDLELLSALGNQAAIGIERAKLTEKVLTEERLRANLTRFHSPDVAEYILSRGGEITPELTEVTVLFSDIKGFTLIAEKLSPRRVAGLLCDYHGLMTDIVFTFGGTLDKYIGDGLMAVFGAPFSRGNHAIQAVETALQMQNALGDWIKGRPSKERFQIRIGINTGSVVAGNIGSPQRMEYTVLGDTVNVASRLEKSAEPGQILTSDSTYGKTKGKFLFEYLGPKQVKGRKGSVKVYAVRGKKGEVKDGA